MLQALVAKLRKSGAAAQTPTTSTEKYTVGMSQHSAGPGKAKGKTSGEGGVTAAVLATLGDLACVAGTALQRHVGDILPLIIDALQDTSSGARPVVAVTCLGQVRHRRPDSPRATAAAELPMLPCRGAHLAKHALAVLMSALPAVGGRAGGGEHWYCGDAVHGVPPADGPAAPAAQRG